MNKKRSAQPMLNDDNRESSTKDLSSQFSASHIMPGADRTHKQGTENDIEVKGAEDDIDIKHKPKGDKR